VEFDNVFKSYDNKILFENLSFRLEKGAILGIIGPNGAGKTTLFRMITGKEQPDSGTITIGSTVKLGYVDQEHTDLNPEDDVFTAITGGQENLIVGNKEINGRAYVAKFNFMGAEQTKKVKQLSGGEKNRAHLAKVLLRSGANVLLLDEPTNDIDVNTLRALEEGIENFAGSAIIISHDRWFLDRVATNILAFEGDSEVIFYEGNFSEYEEFRVRNLGKDSQPHRVRFRTISKA
jgi:ATPase subunit of ABC transporter with duplicated ATPase domains